jgi:hypothetical protein
LISHFLLGHAPKGISQAYVSRLILQNSDAMREAQQKISTRMFELLGLTLGPVGPSGCHDDAPLAPAMPTKKSKAAAPG